MPSANAPTDNFLEQEARLRDLRERLLRPIADKFGFPLGQKSSVVGPPTILCLGNHSSGKSTFINHLAGADIQATGVAPTDDSFTLVTFGNTAETLDGRTAVANPNLPYRDFEQFGKDFLDHLRLKRVPQENLRNLCLVDSPGLIDHAGSTNDSSRGYDFNAAVRLFAETADLVIFFFDPDKPGTTGESLRVFTDALSDVMYKLLIVFNKVDTFADVRDFARTYGSLCWNLSRVVRTKDRPHIYCTFVKREGTEGNRTLDLTDFIRSTDELKREISRVGQRRQTNLIGAALDSARQLRLHAAVTRRIGFNLMVTRVSIWLGALTLLVLGIALTWYYHENSYLLSAAIVSLIASATLALSSGFLLRHRLKKMISRLDIFFHDIFSKELLATRNSRFLEGLWESVKPRTIRFLQSSSISKIPFSPLWHKKLRQLKNATENDIPALLEKSNQA